MNENGVFDPHTLCSAEFRLLNEHEKAVELVHIHQCSMSEAAKYLYLHKSKVSRATTAASCGRDVGVNGRPNKMTAYELQLFCEVLWYQVNIMGERIGFKEASQIVNLSSSLNLTFKIGS